MPKMDKDRGDGFAFGRAEVNRQDEYRRVVVASRSGPTMKRFSAAAALLIAGRPGRELCAPEPLVQVGFDPAEDEMDAIVEMAKAAGRDLIHIGCLGDGSGQPTGMMAVVFFEDGKAAAPPSRRIVVSARWLKGVPLRRFGRGR